MLEKSEQKCKKCGALKPIESFSINSYTVKGRKYSHRRSACKECQYRDNRERNKRNYVSKYSSLQSLEGEIWKDVPGYKGLYFASSKGRISREMKNILSPETTNRGYLRVILSKNGKVEKSLVHRIIAKSFHENPENKPQVNHKSGVITDNRPENLEWVTMEENIQHSLDNNFQGKHTRSRNTKIREICG